MEESVEYGLPVINSVWLWLTISRAYNPSSLSTSLPLCTPVSSASPVILIIHSLFHFCFSIISLKIDIRISANNILISGKIFFFFHWLTSRIPSFQSTSILRNKRIYYERKEDTTVASVRSYQFKWRKQYAINNYAAWFV